MSKEIRISELIIPKYYAVFRDWERVHKILTSGRAGTKSSYAAIECVFSIISDDNCSIVVLRKHHNKLRKTVYKEILRAITRLGLSKKDFIIKKSPMEITYKKNGNTIYFTGSDSVDDTKGIIDENKPIKKVLLDEITEFFDSGEGADELSNIEATFVRGNDDTFQMIYLFNPPKNPNAPIMEWLQKMKQRPDVLHVHTDYRDVPVKWLGKRLIQTAEAMANIDPKLYKWVWLGLCVGIDDLVYYMFNKDKHVYAEELSEQERKEMGKIGVGVDFGMQNATTFEAFGVDHRADMLRGLKEYYYSGRDTGVQRSPSDYAKDLKEFCDEIERDYDRVVSWVFIDPSASGLKEEFKRIAPHISTVNAENDVKLGISRVQKVLSYGKMVLSKEQPMLIKEMGLYQYNKKSIEKGKEEVVKEKDHCQDATRYVVMGMWKEIKRMLPKSERG